MTLAGSMVWLGERHIPSVAPTLAPLFDRKTQEALLSHRTSHLAQKTQGLAKEAQTVNLQVHTRFMHMGLALVISLLFLYHESDTLK